MNLFDFEVEQVYEKKKAKKPIQKSKFVVPKIENTQLPSHITKISKQEYLNRLISLKEQIQPYKHLSDEAIKKISIEEFETVRCGKIQIELLQNKLK